MPITVRNLKFQEQRDFPTLARIVVIRRHILECKMFLQRRSPYKTEMTLHESKIKVNWSHFVLFSCMTYLLNMLRAAHIPTNMRPMMIMTGSIAVFVSSTLIPVPEITDSIITTRKLKNIDRYRKQRGWMKKWL